MTTNRLLNERMPDEEFEKVVKEYIDYIRENITPKHKPEGYKPSLTRHTRIEVVLKQLMKTRSVYRHGLALIPYSQNIEKYTLPGNITADILENGTRALGYIGAIIDNTTIYPPYPKGDAYSAHVNKKVKIACTYGTFAIYDGYVYLACHVDDDCESYLYVPVQSISWDFSNPMALLLYELLYYNSTTMLSLSYENKQPLMQLKPTSINYLVPLEFCQGLINQLEGGNWNSYRGLSSVWSKYSSGGFHNVRADIEIGNFSHVFKDAFDSVKSIQYHLEAYERELTYEHTRNIANRDRIVNIIKTTRQNFEDIVSEFNTLRFNAIKIILTYFDGSVLSIIKILHELIKYADSKFGNNGMNRMIHDNVRIDDSLSQYDREAIVDEMRPFYDVANDNDLSVGTMNRILNDLGDIGYSVSALKNLHTPYLQLVRNIFMPGPVFLRIIQTEIVQKGVAKYTIRNGLEGRQLDTIKVLPSLHTKRYLDNILNPMLGINFSSLTPTYARPVNQAVKATQNQYCPKPYIDMQSIFTPERDAFKAFKATQPVPPDPDPENDDDDFMSAEEVEECIRNAQAESKLKGTKPGTDNAIRWFGMDGLRPVAT